MPHLRIMTSSRRSLEQSFSSSTSQTLQYRSHLRVINPDESRVPSFPYMLSHSPICLTMHWHSLPNQNSLSPARSSYAPFDRSKLFFDIISRGSRTREKRIMLDIHAARQSYRNRQISKIGFVRSNDNLAHELTKQNMQPALLNLLLTGKHFVKWEQWILRAPLCINADQCVTA